MNKQISSIAKKVRKVRASKGLNPEQVKTLTGVSPRTLARLEALDSPTNVYVPRVDTLQKFAAGMGYKLGDFLNTKAKNL